MLNPKDYYIFSDKFKKIENLIGKGLIKEAKSQLSTDLNQFEKYMLTTLIHIDLGEIHQAMEVATLAINLSRQQNNIKLEVMAMLFHSFAIIHTGPYDQLSKTIETIETKMEKLENNTLSYSHSLFLTIKGTLSHFTGNEISGINDLENAIQQWKNQGNKPQAARSLHHLGRLYQPIKALPIIEESRLIWHSMGNVLSYGKASCFLGYNHIALGNFNTAFELNSKALEIGYQENNTTLIANASECLGNIFLSRGEYETAITHFTRSKESWISNGRRWPESASRLYLGRTYLILGDMNNAISNLKKTLDLRSDLGMSNSWLIDPIFYLICAFIYNDQKDMAIDLKNKLEIIYLKDPKPINKIYLKLSECIILTHKTRLRDKISAAIILDGLNLNYEEINWGIKITGFKLRCELLLLELEVTYHDEILSELTLLIDEINMIAKKQFLPSEEIESTIFKSKLELIRGNSKLAMDLLHSAHEIAEHYNINHLVLRINDIIKRIQEDIQKWINIDETTPLFEKIKELELKDYLDFTMKLKNDNTTE
ncbi:MAG: tetratricopeptide repeat protein [Candidatus Heimdallarchaeota archaeon]|nr:tetratricopeptide repeat protein [Candidatus Heimdallarchaeota archaeon]MDH5646522.1 tetratricopeptide repeat protein [Candidatus Heimdallarchaeota archaeon]